MFTKTDISDGNNFPILCVSTLNILFQKFGDIYQYNKLNNSINLLKLNVESNKCGYRTMWQSFLIDNLNNRHCLTTNLVENADRNQSYS